MARRPTFEESLAKINQQQRATERREMDAPRIYFLRQAVSAGFSDTQAKFMWNFLAQKDHEHWNGLVG